MADISSWSPVASSNNAAPPNGFPEGQAPSSVNDASREVMAAIRRWYDVIGAILNTGSVYAESRSAADPEVGGYYIDGLAAIVKGNALIPGGYSDETWGIATNAVENALIIMGNGHAQFLHLGSTRNQMVLVSELPTPAGNRQGDEYTVTDALGPGWGAVAVGGGTEVVNVICDGSSWRYR